MAPLKKIVLILLLSFSGLFLLGKIADKGYYKCWRVFYDKFDVVFNDSSNYDILLLGNSTVNFGINPYYVDSVTKLKTYNLGYGGANIEMMNMLLHGYLETHPKPKVVLLSLENSSFWHDDLSNHFLLFNYLQNKYAENYLENKGYKTRLIKVLPFLKYSYYDDYNRGNIISGFYQPSFEKNALIYKGFINNKSNSLSIKTTILTNHESTPLDKKNIDIFYELLKYCKQQQIRVVFIFPPRVYPSLSVRFQGIYAIDTLIRNATTIFGIPYQRYDDPKLFQLNEFTDPLHLNKQASTKYSIIIGKYIDSCIILPHNGYTQ